LFDLTSLRLWSCGRHTQLRQKNLN